ncbi:hypothetical protein N665_0019s0040 [Sinapis alba]|nr:hypothetical protein N665_0019s0040 [Sinapis alba]
MIQYNAWFKIHASFKNIWMVRVKHHLPTEEWLYMDIFNLSSATGQYQTITQCYKLSIHNNTVIIQGDLPFNNEFFYTFIKFADISNEISKPNFLVDVIGQVHNLGDMKHMEFNGKETKKVEFQLRDANDQILAWCLQGQFAAQSESYNQEGLHEHITICVIRFAKVGLSRETRPGHYNDNDKEKFMLLDSIAKLVVGFEADELPNGSLDEMEDPEALPPAITNVNGKTIQFGVYVNKKNVCYGAEIYMVDQIWMGDKIVTIKSHSDPTTQFNPYSSCFVAYGLSLANPSSEDTLEVVLRL